MIKGLSLVNKGKVQCTSSNLWRGVCLKLSHSENCISCSPYMHKAKIYCISLLSTVSQIICSTTLSMTSNQWSVSFRPLQLFLSDRGITLARPYKQIDDVTLLPVRWDFLGDDVIFDLADFRGCLFKIFLSQYQKDQKLYTVSSY